MPRQDTSTASDVWAVGRVILSLMNGEPVRERYSYAAGDQLPTFTNGSDNQHGLFLADLVRNCLEPLPADRPTCIQLWNDVVHNTARTLDPVSGLAMRDDQPDPTDHEFISLNNDLPLMLTLPA